MKNKVCILIGIIILLISTNVYAVEGKIEVIGDTTIELGETKELEVNLSTTGEAIGVISTVITYSDNVSNVKITGENGWQITYNENNGKINALKAEGSKNEKFMKIQYTVNSKNTANIKLGDIAVSTIEYTSENLPDIVKNIKTKEETVTPDEKKLTEISISNKASKTTYTEGEKVDTTGLKVIAKYSDGTSKEIKNYTYTPTKELKIEDKKVEISYTEKSIIKKVSYDIKVNVKKEENKKEEDTTISNDGKIPQTGDKIIYIIPILGLGVTSIIFYTIYRMYKEI